MKNLKFNYLILLMVLLISLLTPSCNEDKFLKEQPRNFLAPVNTLVNSLGFETAVLGLYYHQQSQATLSRGFGAFLVGEFLVGTDVAMKNPTGYWHADEAAYTYESGWSGSSAMWRWGYTGLAYANMIINNIDKPDIAWTAPTDKNRFLAEAKWWRASIYRDLVYLFGDVPLIKEISTPARYDFVRSPQADITKLMREDLLFAVENLPATVSQPGRLTKAAAQHRLGELYLFLGENANAQAQFEAIINSGQYALVTARFGSKLSSPGDYYWDLWQLDNQNLAANKEAIFVLQRQYQNKGADYQSWERRMMNPGYIYVSGMTLCDSLGGRSLGDIEPLLWWIDSYEPQDLRNSSYNLRRAYWYNDPKFPALLGKICEYTPALRNSGGGYPHPTKFYYMPSDNAAYANTCKDQYVIRLAETYLLLAEAQLKQGNTTGAAASINMVRNRVKATPVTPAQVNMDYILDERARELYGEERRNYTLRRTGMLLSRVRKLNDQSKAAIKDYNVLWPIPQFAIDQNIKAAITQNPGYKVVIKP